MVDRLDSGSLPVLGGSGKPVSLTWCSREGRSWTALFMVAVVLEILLARWASSIDELDFVISLWCCDL